MMRAKRVLARTGAITGLIALLLLAAWLSCVGCASSGGRAAAPTAQNCIRITVWSNGAHTSLALPAAAFEPSHPVRRLFPEARHFLIGYGERDFYLDPDPGVWRVIRAGTPPSPAVLHIIASETGPVERTVWFPKETQRVAVSREGLARITADIADAMRLDAQGAPIITSAGRVPGASVFVEAQPGFHLFHMCNHWAAGRLRNAGVAINPRLAFYAPWLTGALARREAGLCPPTPSAATLDPVGASD